MCVNSRKDIRMQRYFRKISVSLLAALTLFSSTGSSILEVMAEEDSGNTETTDITDESSEETSVEAQSEQVKGSAGAVTINELTTEIYAGATEDSDTDGNKAYTWNAKSSDKDHKVAYRINYSTSGEGELEADEFHFTVPMHVIKDKNGSWADEYEMSLPSEEEFEEAHEENPDTFLTYREQDSDGDGVNDELYIYNATSVSAALSGYVEVGYKFLKTTFEYTDGTALSDFKVTLTERTVTKDSNTCRAKISTNAILSSASFGSTAQKRYTSWQSSWGNDIKPENADDYYYTVWDINLYVKDDTTQKYTLSLDSTFEATKDGVEVVGYRINGGAYSKQNYIESCSTKNTVYASMITAYPKSEYSSLTSLSIKNNLTAKLTPSDGLKDATTITTSRTFKWQIPIFVVPSGDNYNVFVHGNGTWVDNESGYGYWTGDGSNDYSAFDGKKGSDYENYQLEEFVKGKITEIDDLTFYAHTYNYYVKNTLKDGGNEKNPDDYFQKAVTTSLESQNVYLEELSDEDNLNDDYKFKSEPLTSDDYVITSLDWSRSNYKYTFNEEEQKFEASSYATPELYYIYVKTGDSDEWQNVLTYNPSTNSYGILDSNVVTNVNGQAITFNKEAKVYKYKIETTNTCGQTSMYARAHITLNNTETVMNYCNDKDVAYLFMQYADNFIDATVSKYDFDRIVPVQRSSSLEKSVVGTSNNTKKKSYTISWKVNMLETITKGSGTVEQVSQNGGTFYDLLPEGSTFDKDSVAVMANGTTLSDGDYTINVTNNFKNSGRILLTVKVTTQAKSYTLYYDTIHSWESLKDYGMSELNPVAYETGNDEIAHGYYDDPTKPSDEDGSAALQENDRKWFKNLSDSDNSKARFIYTDRSRDIVALTSAASGLTKKVMGGDTSAYSYNATVSINGTYSYRLRYQNTYTSKASNLILYDSLENYTTSDGKSSDWHGTVQYVDVSQLTDKGADAKIYYSTVSGLDLEENHELSNTSIWTLADSNTDLSGATAIAIDATKDTDGNDFQLEAGSSVSAFIYMVAPSESPETSGDYPTSYNNVYMSNTLQTSSGTENYFIHQENTAVKLAVTGNVSLKKVNANNENEALSGLQFRLNGTSDYGTAVDSILTTNSNGQITFEGVEKGTYTLSEYDATADYQLDYTPHTVVIDGNGHTSIDGTDYTDSEILLTNKPRIHADITFNKKSLGSNKSIDGAQFKLSGTSDYGNDVLKYATSEKGKVTFENVELGTYTIVETKAASGYVLNANNKYTVRIDENGMISWSMASGDEDTLEVSGTKTTIYNEEKHRLGIYKVNSYDYSAVSGVTFRLAGTSDAGNKFDLEATTSASGITAFGGLESGTYVLSETAVSDDSGVTLDETRRIVTIDKYGNTEIEGVEKDSLGNFIIVDSKKADKTVTVIKKWKDADGTSVDHSQDLPKIHIEATANKADKTVLNAESLNDVVYNGTVQAQEPTVKNSLGETLTKNVDYTLSYSYEGSNTNISPKHVGTVVVTANGIGNYSGSATTSYKITKKGISVTTESSTREYNQTALTASGITVDGVATGDTYSATTTGAQLEVGSYPNTYTLTIFSDGNDVTNTDYEIISENLGTLIVTDATPPITPTIATYSSSDNILSDVDNMLASAFNLTTVNAEESTTITFDANGGAFEDGSTTNTINYGPKKIGTVTKYSHTDNISDDGTQNSNYGTNEAKTEVVTIEGASSLTVTVTYGGESASYDWVSIFSGAHSDYTAASNYSSADIAQKLGGGSHTSQTKTYTVTGDSVTFAWKSDGSGYGDGYGYYAVVSTGFIQDVTGTYKKAVPADAKTKKFIGWSTSSTATEATYAKDGSGIPTDQNLTLYAVYADFQWCEDWSYKLDDTAKTIWIYKYNGAETDYTVPASAKIDGVTYTTKIGNNGWNGQYVANLKTNTIQKLKFESGIVLSTDMYGIFFGCSNLTSLDVSNFDTSMVTDMS